MTRNNPLHGALYFLRGVRLAFVPGVRRYVVVPLAINVALFGSVIYLGADAFARLLDQALPSWLDWLAWLLLPLFLVVALVVVFFTFSLVGNLIAAPFNGLLAEAVERHLTGRSTADLGWKQLVADLYKAIVSELRKLAYVALWGLPLLVLTFVPLVNAVAAPLWILFSAWMLAIEFADFPMGNHGLAFPEQRRRLAERRFLSLGFGAAVMIVLAIPFVNFLVIPAAVAGATALWVEELGARPAAPAREGATRGGGEPPAT